MDSLTQVVLGAAVGEAVLGKKVGNKAMFWGAVGGTIPDLDVLSRHFTDSLTAIEIHRGFSHSIVFALLISPILGWLLHKIYQRKGEANFKDWSLLIFWSVFTHPILDSFTTWGTQLFWPAEVRLAFKNIFVIDPSYTLPFLFCLVVAMFFKRTDSRRQFWNKLGIYLSSFYMLISLGMKAYTYNIFKSELDNQNIEYTDISTRPTPFNILLWSANIQTEKDILVASYSIFDSKPIAFYSVPKKLDIINQIPDTELVSRIKKITHDWFVVRKESEQSYLFHDLRFGQMELDNPTADFAFSYRIKKENDNWIGEEVEKKRDGEEAKALLTKLWIRLQGN
jgi:inner membrane protein